MRFIYFSNVDILFFCAVHHHPNENERNKKLEVLNERFAVIGGPKIFGLS